MRGFRNFTSAMDEASEHAVEWVSEDGTKYNYAEMMLLAAHLDLNEPLDDRLWYVTFPDGEICMLHEDFEEIMSLFKPSKRGKIARKFTGDEFTPPKEDRPEYCPYCGKKIKTDAVYCPYCGKKVN